MLGSFLANIYFLFIQISMSAFLIWLCNRKADGDDDNYFFVKSHFKKKFKLHILIDVLFILIGFILLLINIFGVDVGMFLDSKNKDSFSLFKVYIGLSITWTAFNMIFNSIYMTMLNKLKYRRYYSNSDKKDDKTLLSKYYIRSLFFWYHSTF